MKAYKTYEYLKRRIKTLNTFMEITKKEFNLSEKIEGQMKTIGKSIPLADVKEFIRLLKERIKINGNLSNRIIENKEGEFENKHDFVLNNMVLEIIDEISGEDLI